MTIKKKKVNQERRHGCHKIILCSHIDTAKAAKIYCRVGGWMERQTDQHNELTIELKIVNDKNGQLFRY